MSRAQQSQPKGGAADEDDFANQVGVPAILDEEIDQPPADHNVRNGGEDPGHARVKKRVQQIDVQRK